MYYVVDFYFYADIVGVLCVEGRIGGTKKMNEENEKAQNIERISREKCMYFHKIQKYILKNSYSIKAQTIKRNMNTKNCYTLYKYM